MEKSKLEQHRYEDNPYVFEMFYNQGNLTHVIFFSNPSGKDSINIFMRADDYLKFRELIKFAEENR